MEILLGYAIFWFIDRSVRQIGRDVRDEYRKVTGWFTGKRAEKHPAAGKPPVTWRAGVKTAAVLGAGTVGAGRGGKNFATGFRDRWTESRRLAKANRNENRRRQVQPPDDTKPGTPRRLTDPRPDREPAADTCAVAGCRLKPVLPSTGRCFDHSNSQARVAWLKDHEPVPASKVDLVKKPTTAASKPASRPEREDTRSVGGLRDPYPDDQPTEHAPQNQPGGTVTEAVNYGQMIAACETHIQEATAELESGKHGEREANLAMEDARASLQMAGEEASKVEAEAATLAGLRAPASLTHAVAELQNTIGLQQKAAEKRMTTAEQQKNTAAERISAAEAKLAAGRGLMDELKRLQNVVEAVDSLGGPDAIPEKTFLTHG